MYLRKRKRGVWKRKWMHLRKSKIGLGEEMDAPEDKEERKEEVEVVPLIIRKKRKRRRKWMQLSKRKRGRV
jgi:hypothetical protein